MAKGVYTRLSGSEMKERLAKLKDMQESPFSQKIEIAKKTIETVSKKGKIAIMFSGGRDSCALALLSKEFNPVLLYCNTGLSTESALKRVQESADKIGLPLNVVYPREDAFTMWSRTGHYPIAPKRGHTYLKAKMGVKTSPVQCCYNLKEVPAKKFIKDHDISVVLWGNRADDSNRRKLGVADHGIIQPPSKKWTCWSVQPIAFFLDDEISSIVAPLELDFTARGEDGCQVCCTDLGRKDNQLTRCFVSNRSFFEQAIMSGLGAEILKARGDDRDVEEVLKEEPYSFLRIPKIGKQK